MSLGATQLAGEIAKALDHALAHVGELYIDAACHLAAVEGACDDAAEALRCLEDEAAATAASSTAAMAHPQDVHARTANASHPCAGAGKVAGGGAGPSVPPLVRARPAAAACGRLQVLHAALGKCMAEFGVSSPALLADGPSADEEAFVHALSGTQATFASAAAGGTDPRGPLGARSYGGLCAAHASGLEVSAALRAAVELALEGQAGTRAQPAELCEVAAQCARLLLERGDKLRADADSQAFERLQARAARYRAVCLAALTPKEPASMDGMAAPQTSAVSGSSTERAPPLAASDGWWLRRGFFFDTELATAAVGGRGEEARPALVRVLYRSARELERRYRTLLAAQASAAQLSIERCVSSATLPLLRRMAGVSAAGRGALLALFRLVHCVLCANGRRMVVFLAQDESFIASETRNRQHSSERPSDAHA